MSLFWFKISPRVHNEVLNHDYNERDVNMFKNGTRPIELDPRDFSFARTFGAINKDLIGKLPFDFSVDAGMWMPDQNAELNPYSCTGYAVCDIGTNQDKIVYQPKYAYMKNLFMQGLPPETNGSEIRPALKQPKVYGLLPIENTPENIKNSDEDYSANQGNWPVSVDAIASKMEHKKGNYFNVYLDSGLDWYNSIRSAIWVNKDDMRAVLVGTPWLWNSAPNGILDENFNYDGDPYHYGWHAWNICGWTMLNTKGAFIRNGEIFLKGKPWAGKNYGDEGFVYLSPRCINRLMEIRGCAAFTLADARKEDIESIKLSIWEQIAYYLHLITLQKRLA